MATYKLEMTKAALVDSRTPDANHALSVGDSVLIHRDKEAGEIAWVYIGFQSLPNSIRRKKLIGIQQIGLESTYDGQWFARGISGDFNANTITYNNRPAHNGQERLYSKKDQWISSSHGGPYTLHWFYQSDSGWIEHPDKLITIEKSVHAKDILRHSALAFTVAPRQAERTVSLYGDSFSSYVTYDHIYHGTPYIIVEYDNGDDLTSQITPSNNKSGYLNPAKAQTFNWDFVSSDGNYVCAGDFAQASATLYWKEHSASAYNQIAASGSTKSVTVPANTFPNNTQIDWYVRGTDEDGTTTTSSVYTISTSDAEAVATATSPLNTVEDGNGPITFTWNLSNAYGNDPSRVRIWWKQPSEDNNHWHVLVDRSEAFSSYTAPAGTFPAGEIQWKVQAFNADGVEGTWDANLPNPKTFICVAAPEAPNGISSDGVPYATITWQCDGQQAYRIEIDGVDYGVRFGTDKSITLNEPLSDGSHTVTITAQGVYGLWSQPGTGTIQIANDPGDGILLTVRGTTDAELEWASIEDDLNIYIYRDDVKIGHTNGNAFTDRLALGTHSYYVINRLENGNYAKSNVVSITLNTERTMIATYPPKLWLDIELTENSAAKDTFSYQRTVSTRHFLGAAYPVLEMSPFEDVSASYETAAMDMAAAKSFEQLKGKVVCIKSRMGVVFVGIMSTMQKKVGEFFASYTFTVKRIHYEDYVDDTID